MRSAERRPYRRFGSWLRSRRLARRWSQEELARLLDYDVTYVRKIEWGERPASEAFRVRLAQVLALPLTGLPASASESRLESRLPATASPLIGRDKEVATLVELVRGGARLVTLLGAPGIGKTRLALEVAERLDEEMGCGVHFVALTTVGEANAVPDAIAAALGLVLDAGRPTLETVADALRGEESLLVLDNFEHLLEAAPAVGRLLTDLPSLQVVVTSRQTLDLALETHFWVSTLPVPDASALGSVEATRTTAVELFVARARMVRPEFKLDGENLPVVVAICARLQGLPLAIELAAATARLMPPRELLARLGTGLDLPISGPRDAPAHHRTLRAAIDWSHRQLDAQEQALFARLGVFEGGCTLEALAAVCDWGLEPHSGPVELAASLVAKSLLEPVPDAASGARVVALEAIRSFALEQLERRAELDQTQRRHAEYFAEFAESNERTLTGAGQALGLSVSDEEHPNLRAALRWATAHDAALAVRIAGALWRFWLVRGHFEEGRRSLEAVLLLEGPRSPARVRALNGLGVLTRTQGEYDLAEARFKEAEALARCLGDEEGLALSVLNLGIVAASRLPQEGTFPLFEEAKSIYARLADHRGVGHALNCMGAVQVAGGDVDGAATSFHESLRLFREVDDPWSVAHALTNLGWVEYKRGRSAVARRFHEQSLDVCRSLGDERGVANAIANLGFVAVQECDTEAAAALFQEALITFSRLGDRRGIVECLDELATLAVAQGHDESAAALMGAIDNMLQASDAGRPSSQSRKVAPAARTLEDRLGQDQLTAAWDEGRTWTVEQAIDVALRLGHETSGAGRSRG